MVAVTPRRLSAEFASDVSDLQSLHETSSGYHIIVSGHPPKASEALDTLFSLPPGKSMDDKFVFGYYLGQNLIGCAELIRSYPEQKSAHIGLLLISGPYQGLGLGRSALAHVYATASAWGCTTIQLAVIETNTRAFSFWLGQGFKECRRKAMPQFTGQAIVMHRLIPVNPIS